MQSPGAAPSTPQTGVVGVGDAFPTLEDSTQKGIVRSALLTVQQVLLDPSNTFRRMAPSGTLGKPFLFALVPSLAALTLFRFVGLLMTIRLQGGSLFSTGLFEHMGTFVPQCMFEGGFLLLLFVGCIMCFFPGESRPQKETLRGILYVTGSVQFLVLAILLPALLLLAGIDLFRLITFDEADPFTFGWGPLRIWTWHLPLVIQVMQGALLTIALREIHGRSTRSILSGVIPGFLSFFAFLTCLGWGKRLLGVSGRIPALLLVAAKLVISWKRGARS